MAELPRQSDGNETPAPSYWIEVRGDGDRYVAGDIVDLIHNHYAVKAAIAAPLEIKLSITDAYGATKAYGGTWEPMARLKITTGLTRADLDGVAAQVTIGPVSGDG